MCVVEFDLSIGQQMRKCFPPDALTKEEVSDSAFHAFPDSISGLPSRTSIHDRCVQVPVLLAGPNAPEGRVWVALTRGAVHRRTVGCVANQQVCWCVCGVCSVFDFRVLRRGSVASGREYIYGYVFCRQRTDARLERGGDQQSVLVLSHLPYGPVFKALVRVRLPLHRGSSERSRGSGRLRFIATPT